VASLKSAPETKDHVPRAEHISPIDVMPHQGRSTHDSILAVEGTPPYLRFEGDLKDKSTAALPVAR